MLEAIKDYARQKQISDQDAAQTFLQVVALRHLRLPKVRLIGGTALVLGYGNPRFSEDLDFTAVKIPAILETGLTRAKKELEKWLGEKTRLQRPKPGFRTWQLIALVEGTRSLNLHIDSEPYPALTSRPIIIQYPSIPSFVVESVEVEEIMADKVIALAYRNYLGGRDLFDLWFHWIRQSDWGLRASEIRKYILRKLKQRHLPISDFTSRLRDRLSPPKTLLRAEREWQRYLPQEFQKKAIAQEMLSVCPSLLEVLLDPN